MGLIVRVVKSVKCLAYKEMLIIVDASWTNVFRQPAFFVGYLETAQSSVRITAWLKYLSCGFVRNKIAFNDLLTIAEKMRNVKNNSVVWWWS